MFESNRSVAFRVWTTIWCPIRRSTCMFECESNLCLGQNGLEVHRSIVKTLKAKIGRTIRVIIRVIWVRSNESGNIAHDRPVRYLPVTELDGWLLQRTIARPWVTLPISSNSDDSFPGSFDKPWYLDNSRRLTDCQFTRSIRPYSRYAMFASSYSCYPTRLIVLLSYKGTIGSVTIKFLIQLRRWLEKYFNHSIITICLLDDIVGVSFTTYRKWHIFMYEWMYVEILYPDMILTWRKRELRS